jgi:hypothetical protein
MRYALGLEYEVSKGRITENVTAPIFREVFPNKIQGLGAAAPDVFLETHELNRHPSIGRNAPHFGYRFRCLE